MPLLAAVLATLLLGGQTPASGSAQGAAPSRPAGAAQTALLRVYLDCDSCDIDFLRQNVGFVDYVRDRTVAEVQVLVTTRTTGGGGTEWTVAFLGLARFQGQDRTLTFTTPQTATSDDRRTAFARVFKIGLVAYAATTSISDQLTVTWTPPKQQGRAAPTRDPWNLWVFRTNLNGYLNGEKSSQSRSYHLSLSANRVSENWKVSISGSGSLSKDSFDLGDGSRVDSRTHSWNVDTLVVKSLSPKWSIGFTSAVTHSSYSNIGRSFSVSPGIEYDVFPYSESTRRSLTFQYAAGALHNQYAALTVYDKLRETVPRQIALVSLGLKEPWGSLSAYSSFTQQLNHLDRYRESLWGSTSVRLFKGFSFDIYAEYDKIADQISLQKGEESEADVLLRLHQLATNYSYYLSFGVSYSFGSIFNNVVNPRFNGAIY
jgi:hypothetical protein